MQVCLKDLPKLQMEPSGIVYFAGIREKHMREGLPQKFPKCFENILYILRYLRMFCKISKPLLKIEVPALTHLIREEIFEGEISQRTAYNYAILLKELSVLIDLL
ncbi:hypothetical protein J7L60_01655 [Candidatus Bathyarchaeota archaeon]|nr:hypothetical protein [Candidatus Bathyarchaeota archaeon]